MAWLENKEPITQASSTMSSLMFALSQVTDPRQPRGVRHPLAGILALALLEIGCHIHEFASLQCWATAHLRRLRRPLGFTRGRPPHPTTVSRTLAKFSPEELQSAFSRWLQEILAEQGDLSVAVDGKTSK